jgi:ribosomal protein L11 methyltransferase
MVEPPAEDPGVIPWATLRLRLAAGPRAPELLAAQAEILSGVGTILAEDPDVGGAETRDPGTLGGATRPELWIYTVPAALPRLRALATELCARVRLPVDLATEVREDDDWRDAWKQFYRPMTFGDGALLVRPSWIPREPGDPEREIVIDPGRAFGTGLHESTRLCLSALCNAWESGAEPERVLDLGCGSGILALAAARLWPSAEVLAVDDDPEATDTTRENAELNALHDRLRVRTGQLHDLTGELPFHLFVANIRPDVLVPLAAPARPFLARTGLVILSGILAPERARVAEAWRDAGFHDLGPNDPRLRDGEWHAIVLKPVS